MTSYTYQNGLVKTKTHGTQVDTFNYDTKGNLLSKVDALGNTVTLTYDDFNRLAGETSPSGIVKSYSYDSNNNLAQTRTVVGTALKQDTNITYNLLDHPAQVVTDIDDTHSALMKYEYNYDEKLTKKYLPNGLLEQTTYDTYGRVAQVQEKNTAGTVISTTTYTYDTNGNIVTQTTNGQTTGFTYDLFDRLSKATDALGNIAEYTYNPAGNVVLIQTKDASLTVLSKIENIYNELGLVLTTKKYNLGNSTTQDTNFTYNRNGQVLTLTDALGRVTTNAYDSMGRLSTVTLVNGLQTKNTYDAGNRIVKKEVIAGSKTLTTLYTYDGEGRVLTEKDDLNQTKSYTYNKLHQVTSVTDKKGIVTNYTYDYRGKVLSESRSGKTISYVYDVVGNLIQLTDALGSITTYTYDLL